MLKAKNLEDLTREELSCGEKVAKGVASVVGSWPFILGQSALVLLWVGYNAMVDSRAGSISASDLVHFDPFPYPLLALALALVAATSGPLILLAQARHAEKLEKIAEHDRHDGVETRAQIDIIAPRVAGHGNALDTLLAEIQALGTRVDALMLAVEELGRSS